MTNKLPIVINLYAGPGTGKSTTAAAIFSELKFRGLNCELITEYAKDKVWEESFHTLNNQLYVTAKQYHRLFRVKDKVDVIITDAPLLLSLYYGGHMSDNYKNLVKEIFGEFNNMNFFLNRKKKYNPAGRMQTEDQAIEIDNKIFNILNENNIEYEKIDGDRNAPITIADKIMEELSKIK